MHVNCGRLRQRILCIRKNEYKLRRGVKEEESSENHEEAYLYYRCKATTPRRLDGLASAV